MHISVTAPHLTNYGAMAIHPYIVSFENYFSSQKKKNWVKNISLKNPCSPLNYRLLLTSRDSDRYIYCKYIEKHRICQGNCPRCDVACILVDFYLLHKVLLDSYSHHILVNHNHENYCQYKDIHLQKLVQNYILSI